MHENDVSGASVPPNPSPTGNLAGRRSLASRGHKEASRLHDGDGRWPINAYGRILIYLLRAREREREREREYWPT